MFGPPMCFQCSRFRQYTRAGTAICEAFPRKIPDEIFFQAGDHRLKFRDEDLLFEAENLVALDLVEEFWGPSPTPIEALDPDVDR
jgi:hypothetical protein